MQIVSADTTPTSQWADIKTTQSLFISNETMWLKYISDLNRAEKQI